MEALAVDWTVIGTRTRRCTVAEGAETQEATAGRPPLIDHPEWVALRETIPDALDPFPDARRAMERALPRRITGRAQVREAVGVTRLD